MEIQSFQQTIKYNPEFFTAFCIANGIGNIETAIQKAEKFYNNCLAQKIKPIFKEQAKPKKQTIKRITFKQAQARQSIKDKMQTAKQDMIDHIKNELSMGTYHITEFLADPIVYFDSAIMKQYYNNYIIRQAIISYFKNVYTPF